MAEELLLRSGRTEARISSFGAELTGLCHHDHGDLLWHGDARWWDRASPILFPVVGRSANDRIRVGETSYPMPLHGFAHAMAFEVVERGLDRCLLRLTDSPATHVHYPFPFVLDIAYVLAGEVLSVEATVRNPGGTILPASVGFHPGFRWPLLSGLAKDGHRLVFDADERVEIFRARNGLILPESSILDAKGGVLPLSERLFDDGAMVLTSLRSRRVRFEAPSAPLAIEVGFRNLPFLGIWMKPGADFLCIEPWAGHADPEGFDGHIFTRPGIVPIAPGEMAAFAMNIAIRD